MPLLPPVIQATLLASFMGEPLWFITGFCDRTNELQTKWLEFGVRASFLFNPPAKSQKTDDKSIHA